MPAGSPDAELRPPQRGTRRVLLLILLAPFLFRSGWYQWVMIGPALFHDTHPWERRTDPIMDMVRYVRATTPPDARVYVFRMGDFAYYSGRRLLVDLDPVLLELYREDDPSVAYTMLREQHGVDYVVQPGYTYPTFDNSVVKEVVTDPRYAELVYANAAGWRLYRLKPAAE